MIALIGLKRLAAVLLTTGATGALCGPAAADGLDDVKARLLARYPSTQIDAVNPTPIAGLFEVVMRRKLVYVDATGQYFLFGRIFDLPGNRDLTEERLRDVARLDVSLIQPAQLLEQGMGGKDTDQVERKVVYVFSDPACGHCQKLEQTLAGMPALHVKTVMLPLQPGAADLARDIWCSSDRHLVWTSWMREGKRPDKALDTCDTSILDQNLAIAKQFGIRATPALVSVDGRVSLGAMEAPALSAWLSPEQGAITTVSTEVAQ